MCILIFAAQLSTMYPTSLTQLARANPFSAPLFSLQKVEEPQQSLNGQRPRRLAAAAAVDGKSGAAWLTVASLAVASPGPDTVTLLTKFIGKE